MAVFTYWLPTLLLVLILKETLAFSDPCSELKSEIDYLEKKNHRNEQLVFQCPEQLKNETHVSEGAFTSVKLVENQFKSELKEMEGVISSWKKQLEAKEEILKSDKMSQIQLQATIDGLMKTLETQYLKEKEQYGQPKSTTPILHVTFWLQWLVVILLMVWTGAISLSERHTAQRITELENKNHILEDQNYSLKKILEAKEKCLNFENETHEQMHTTIDNIRMTVETNNRTIQELSEKEKDYKATIDGLRVREGQKKWTIQQLREKEKDYKATIDGLRVREGEKKLTIQQLREKEKTMEQDIGRHLLEAVKSKDVKTVKILCKYANDTCTDNDAAGNTPLIIAATAGHVKIVRLLLESGAEIDRGNTYQETALHEAAFYGHAEVCRVLLDRGAKVNAVNSWNDTPLHIAAKQGQLSVTKLLVERGADVSARDDEYQTASQVAWNNRKIDVANWLDLQKA